MGEWSHEIWKEYVQPGLLVEKEDSRLEVVDLSQH